MSDRRRAGGRHDSGSTNATAKLYVKVGSGSDQDTWHDDGPLAVGSTGQLLRLSLTQIRGRAIGW